MADEVFTSFEEDLPSVNSEDDHVWHDIYTNEDMSKHILNTFVGVKRLFERSVKEELPDLNFAGRLENIGNAI